jgi:uncharacterized Ntn-hydrolase superfamily protein
MREESLEKKDYLTRIRAIEEEAARLVKALGSYAYASSGEKEYEWNFLMRVKRDFDVAIENEPDQELRELFNAIKISANQNETKATKDELEKLLKKGLSKRKNSWLMDHFITLMRNANFDLADDIYGELEKRSGKESVDKFISGAHSLKHSTSINKKKEFEEILSNLETIALEEMG